MKKTDWPVRWDLLLRYRLIEIIALWEGRLTTNHICHAFGIGRQQASKDINAYVREVAPGNLAYDRNLKGYVPTEAFKPVVTQGSAEEYQSLISRDAALASTFEAINPGLPGVEQLPVANCRPKAALVRRVVSAIRQRRKLAVELLNADGQSSSAKTLEPHALIFAASHWQLRAWCEEDRDYVDVRLARLQKMPELINERSKHRGRQDDAWHTLVNLRFRPSSHLSPADRALVCADYGLNTDTPMLELRCRGALVLQSLREMGINAQGEPLHAEVLLELENRAELADWL